jgi:GntR family transcriptional regulator
VAKKKVPASVVSVGSLHLDGSSRAPLFHQIYLALREQILSGKYPNGSQLPGEAELARDLNVSRITTKRALDELAADNLVSRRRGRGTTVAGMVRMPIVNESSFDMLMDTMKSMGRETDVDLLDISSVLPTTLIAGYLEVPEKEKVVRITRVRKLKGAPYSWMATYLPKSLSQNVATEELSTTPLLTVLANEGKVPASVEHIISATSASKGTAKALGVAPGTAVLHVFWIVRDILRRPLFVTHADYRSDRFRYEVKSQLPFKPEVET